MVRKTYAAKRAVIIEVRDGPLEAVTKGTMRMVPACSPGPPILVYTYSDKEIAKVSSLWGYKELYEVVS